MVLRRYKIMNKTIWYIFALFSVLHVNFLYADKDDFKNWLDDYEKQIVKKYKLDDDFIRSTFRDIQYKERIINLDKNQSEFTLTADQYLKNLINKYRITKGRLNLIKHEQALIEVEKKYKVPKEIIVSFWGMETSYGRITGRINPVGSFLNLIYDGRRAEFFERELIALLELIEKGHVSKHAKSSWAGALGNPQFMPTNYLAYGVDADKDGKIDLWNSYEDTFYSMGNFIKKLGWNYGETWGTQVTLTKDIKESEIGLENRQSIEYWEDLGVKPRYNSKKGFEGASKKASLIKIEKENKKDVYFLVYDNFLVIRKWNRSTLYALAIGILHDNFLKKPTYEGYK